MCSTSGNIENGKNIYSSYAIIIQEYAKDSKMHKKEILNYLKSNSDYFYKRYSVEFIGVFGSVARDEANENSDIDILYKIAKDRKLSLFNYLKLTKQLEEYFQKKIDLVRDQALKPQLKKYIQNDISHV